MFNYLNTDLINCILPFISTGQQYHIVPLLGVRMVIPTGSIQPNQFKGMSAHQRSMVRDMFYRRYDFVHDCPVYHPNTLPQELKILRYQSDKESDNRGLRSLPLGLEELHMIPVEDFVSCRICPTYIRVGIPDLPSTITLPPNLKKLILFNPKVLPILPERLIELHIKGDLPSHLILPPGLKVLILEYNTNLETLPPLPSGLVELKLRIPLLKFKDNDNKNQMTTKTPPTTARYMELAAEALLINPELAITYYISACTMFEVDKDHHLQAYDTFKQTIALMIRLEQLPNAFIMLDRLATMYGCDRSKSRHVHRCYLGMIIVCLAMQDLELGRDTLQRVSETPGWMESEESTLANELLVAFDETDDERLALTIKKPAFALLDSHIARLVKCLSIY